MDTLVYFLKGTPWFVYLILVYLIFIGIKSVKGGVIPLWKLFVIPIVFVGMSINEVVTHLKLTPLYIVASLVGLFLGGCFGFWQFKRLKIRVDQINKLLEIEGSWFGLYLIIITFIVKYYVAYNLEVNHSMSPQVIAAMLFASSGLTGAFVGRLVFSLYKIKAGPHADLVLAKSKK